MSLNGISVVVACVVDLFSPVVADGDVGVDRSTLWHGRQR